MSKICTSTEQSKKLIELGIDVNTADMVILHEEPYETSDSKFDGLHQVLCVPFKNYDKEWRRKYKNISYFPAWSLSALLGLIPTGYALDCERENMYFITHKLGGLQERFDNPLDAAFEVIVWLKENNK